MLPRSACRKHQHWPEGKLLSKGEPAKLNRGLMAGYPAISVIISRKAKL